MGGIRFGKIELMILGVIWKGGVKGKLKLGAGFEVVVDRSDVSLSPIDTTLIDLTVPDDCIWFRQ